MISVLRFLRRESRFAAQVGDPFFELVEFRADGFSHRLFFSRLLLFQLRLLGEQFGLAALLRGIVLVGTLGAVNRGKDGLQSVIMLLSERVELVIVASTAMKW